MSFLSRRTSRSDQRGGGAGRRADSEYDDYDYAPDDYQQDDDWSPDQYFSPEGIKGKWAAGARPGDRPGGRGQRDDERGYDEYGSAPQRARGSAGRYGRDAYQQDSYQQDEQYEDYGTGEYEIQDGPDDDRGDRGGGRRRRDRGERGERRLRLGRRDKGDDIWPDDGVSDEDYWASVAADRPFTSGSPLDAEPMNVVNNRPMARPSGAARPAGDSRLPADRPLAAESRYPGESRTGSGRLGPAPGQAGYLGAQGTGSRPMPGGPPAASGQAGPNSGPMARPGGGQAGPNSGPMARPGSGQPGPNSGPMARPGSGQPGPNSGPFARPASGANSGPFARPASGANSGPFARPGTGPNSGPMARPGTGPSPARQATGPSPIAPNAARSATGPTPAYAGTGPIPTRAATGPTPARPATGPSPARPAAGLAQPGFSQSSGSQPTVAQPSLTRAGLGQASFGHASPAQPSFQPNTARVPGRQPERPDWNERTERIDRIVPGAYPDPRHSARSQAPSSAAVSSSAQLSVWGRDDSADRRVPDVREPARHGVTGANAPARRNEDDPLTSKAWSREELVNTDGRSYRVASRRAHVTPDQYTAALTEQTQTFSMNGQYPADPLGATGAYPVRGGQPGQPGQHQGQQSQQSQQGRQSQQRGQHRRQPGPYDQGTASYPYPVQPYSARPSATDQDEDRHGRPSRSAATDAGYNRGADYNRGNGGNDYGGDGGRHNGNGGYNGGYGNGRY